MRDVTRAKIPSLCGAIWRTLLNFYASQDVWVNCYRIHQKSLNFICPFKFYSNFTNKNVSWLHFSWPTQYVLPCRMLSFCVKGCRHKYRSSPEIGERWNSALVGWKVWLTPRYKPLPTCVSQGSGASSPMGTPGTCPGPRFFSFWGAPGPKWLWDMDLQELILECQHFKHHINLNQQQTRAQQPTMAQLYDIIKSDGLESTFANIEVALRIHLTLMPTNCTGERSFSKMIVKNHHRSCMSNRDSVLCHYYEQWIWLDGQNWFFWYRLQLCSFASHKSQKKCFLTLSGEQLLSWITGVCKVFEVISYSLYR